MKRTFTRLAAIATVGTALAFAPAVSAQPAAGGSPAPAAPRAQRICIVNIAKVLQSYNKANFQGAEITKKRQVYVTQVTALRDQLAAVNKEFQTTQNPDLKKQLQEKGLSFQRQIEDIDRKAQAELTQLSNDTIVRVYQEIKGVIADIAKTNNLDMVLAYPAATKETEENSPQVAQLMLQTPALIPFYHRGMDITDVVVQTLNARYPSDPPPAPPVSTTSGTTTPGTVPPK
ncbi:MAG TPA: OmpH family outer membrane protein [Gemmataceae bacterium]|nr:OmpH family outer membrane protein [Gemmataceae bacterium]